MMKAIIIDDEKHCVFALENDLKQFAAEVEIVDRCYSAKEGMLAIRKWQPDLIFLDVEMPWMNGFEMLEALGDTNFAVIFTTAHDAFAARAFRISAVDFLLKPIDRNDLADAIVKARSKVTKGAEPENISTLLHNIKQPEIAQRIALPQRDGYDFVELRSIVCLKAEGAYTSVVLEDGRSYLVSRTLGDVEELLPAENFQRIHHSTVINLSFVAQLLRTDGGLVVMKNGERFSVSRSRKEALFAQFGLG